MKKLTVLSLLAAFLLCSCGTQPAAPAEGEAEAPAEDTVLTAADAAYDELTKAFADTMMKGWYSPTSEELGVSDIYECYPESAFSFAKADINGDGIPELLFSEVIDDGWATGIYDAYTFSADTGEMIHFFSGGERDVLFINQDGRINEVGSNGADDSIDAWYTLNPDGTFAEAEPAEGDDFFLQSFDMTLFVEIALT